MESTTAKPYKPWLGRTLGNKLCFRVEEGEVSEQPPRLEHIGSGIKESASGIVFLFLKNHEIIAKRPEERI